MQWLVLYFHHSCEKTAVVCHTDTIASAVIMVFNQRKKYMITLRFQCFLLTLIMQCHINDKSSVEVVEALEQTQDSKF